MIAPFDGLHNFRAVEGVRAGVLYRSDELSRLSAADGERLRGLGIRVICDLRSERERRKKPARLAGDCGIRLVHVPIQDDEAQRTIRNQLLGCLYSRRREAGYMDVVHAYYRQMAFERAERIGEVVRLLGRSDSLPAVIHCTAGKDRTGLVAALVQLVMGVDYGTVREEYLRTNVHMAGQFARFARVMRVMTFFRHTNGRLVEMASAQPEFLDRAHAEIVERHGSVAAYLTSACGVGEEELESLRRQLAG